MPEAKHCSKYKLVKFEGPQKSQKNTSQRAMQKPRGSKKASTLQQKLAKSGNLSTKAFYSPTATAAVRQQSATSAKGQRSSSPAVAPILGLGPQQLGLEMSTVFCSSSSDEWTSDSENELIIDG